MNEMNTPSNLKSQFETSRRIMREYLRKLSLREKLILTALASILLVAGSYQLYIPISEAFSEQSKKITETERDLENVTTALNRYMTLKQRRESIENAYKEVEIKEGALSYLETLIRNKAGIASGFTIKDRPVREFGGNYEQSSFSIKFGISDYPRLVDFFTELVQGTRPLILASIDLKKRPAGDALDVELDVSSIRKVK